jgi:hypothetical protein
LLMAALLSGASVSSADADVVKNTSAIMPGEILPTHAGW